MRVSDLMTKNVFFVRTNEPCSAAVRIMWDHDCGAVPVKGDDGERVLGMITDRDICMAAWSQDRPPSAIAVSQAMSRELYSCAPEDGVGLAENVMRSKQVRRIPVLDATQRLVGILSLADIACAQAMARTSLSSEVAPQEIASTLTSICQRP